MYCVIHSVEKFFAIHGSNELEFPDVKVFEDESLAKLYLKNRYFELVDKVDKNSHNGKYEFMHRGSNGDGTWALICYTDNGRKNNCLYQCTYEEFNLIEVPDILTEANITLKKIKNK